MSKTHYRLVALVLSVALLGLVMLAPEALAKKPKRKRKSTEDFVYRAPTVQLNASPTVLTACAGQPARVQLDGRASFPAARSKISLVGERRPYRGKRRYHRLGSLRS